MLLIGVTMSTTPGHRSLFPRIFILYCAILLLALAAMELTMANAVRTNSIDSLRRSLEVQAELIGRSVPFRAPAPLDGLCGEFKQATHARVTVVAPDGRVLGDSDHESATMDNHLSRLEVQQARLEGTGATVRRSDTMGYDFLYVAKKIEYAGGTKGFIRLSVPLKDVDASVNFLRFKLILAVSIILAATGLFTFWQFERLRRLTGQVRDFALVLAKGDLGKRLLLRQGGEFDEIVESLNTMSAELKKSIAATEEERNRLAVILSNIPDALLISDARGVVRIASAASRSFFGDAPLRGKLLAEVVRNREFFSLLDRVRRDRLPSEAEFTIGHPQERNCMARISPLSYAPGEISGHVVIFHDITQLKKLEQMRKDFVANLSHEIKTPIAAISGFTDTLLDGALDDREHARKFIEIIRDNSLRINRLVDDLMTISKIELGAIPVEKSAVAFEDAAETVLSLLRDKAREKGLSLAASIPPGFGTIEADRDRLIQILTNLVDNAIKFTESGGVTFGIGEENSGRFIFVLDTGIGIPEKHLSRLGERFYRVDANRSRKLGGTGLGLAIVKHLVRAHKWDMRIESTAGKGTRIKILVDG